jgi:hypothetical protein
MQRKMEKNELTINHRINWKRFNQLEIGIKMAIIEDEENESLGQ